MLVLPTGTAPAASSRSTTKARPPAGRGEAGQAAVVGAPGDVDVVLHRERDPVERELRAKRPEPVDMLGDRLPVEQRDPDWLSRAAASPWAARRTSTGTRSPLR